MARKTYTHVLTALSSQELGPGSWATNVTMRDWDDDSEISFQLTTPFQILKLGNLSIRADLPAPVPPPEEPFPWGDDPTLGERLGIFNRVRDVLYSRQGAVVVFLPAGRLPAVSLYAGDFSQVPGEGTKYYTGFTFGDLGQRIILSEPHQDLTVGEVPPPIIPAAP